MRAPVVVARARETVRRATSASIEMRVNVPWRLGATRTGARFATVANILLTSVGENGGRVTARGQVSSAVKHILFLYLSLIASKYVHFVCDVVTVSNVCVHKRRMKERVKPIYA